MSIPGLDTPDFLPGPQLGQGFIVFGKTLTVPADGGVLDGPYYIGQFDKCWVAATPSGVYVHDIFLAFSNDALGTHRFNTQPITKNTSVTSLAPMDALGQFVYFGSDNSDSVPHDITYSIFGTNSDARPEQLYTPFAAMDVQNLVVPAHGAEDIWPQYMQAGRYRVWTQAAQAGVLAWQFWTGGGWSFFNQVAFSASPGMSFEVTVPADDWQAVINNTSASSSSTYLSMVGPY